MTQLHVGFVGFDITPQFHPTCGAWGSSPAMTELDMPLCGRCLVLQQDDRRLVWFGFDLFGEMIRTTDQLRGEVAEGVGVPADRIVWSTSQTHSSGVFPGSTIKAGLIDTSKQDSEFMAGERTRFVKVCIDAGREAIGRLQPATVWAGRGHCDSMNYNSRFPMPTGGTKFSRQYGEGLQSAKFFDPTIAMVRFEDREGKPIGSIFNFGCRLATIISSQWVSPDWVGTAREYVEEAIGGAPALYVQGMCGDVTCYHLFGTPDQAKQNGAKVGNAAVQAMSSLIPARGEPLDVAFESIDIPRQPMPSRQWFEQEIKAREQFVDLLAEDPSATWVCGINLPEQMTVAEKTLVAKKQIDYMHEGLTMIDGDELPHSYRIPMGAVRIGDVGAVLVPGINFTATGHNIRLRSPFVHTLICGETGGILGYIGTDEEIDRGGYETQSYWYQMAFDGFRRPPAKGSADHVVDTACGLLEQLQHGRHREEHGKCE